MSARTAEAWSAQPLVDDLVAPAPLPAQIASAHPPTPGQSEGLTSPREIIGFVALRRQDWMKWLASVETRSR